MILLNIPNILPYQLLYFIWLFSWPLTLLQPDCGQVWWVLFIRGCESGQRSIVSLILIGKQQAQRYSVSWRDMHTELGGEKYRICMLRHISESALLIQCRVNVSIDRNSRYQDIYLFAKWQVHKWSLEHCYENLSRMFKNNSNFTFLWLALSKLLREE